jgi:hypothetical protein
MEFLSFFRGSSQTSKGRLCHGYRSVSLLSIVASSCGLNYWIQFSGNNGDMGAWYTDSPASGTNIISVGSTDNAVQYLQKATVSTGYGPIYYDTFNSLPITGSRPIYALSNDTTIANDACDPLPDSTPDLSPYVVIIRRGSCTFVQKLTNAAAKGMKQALIYK